MDIIHTVTAADDGQNWPNLLTLNYSLVTLIYKRTFKIEAETTTNSPKNKSESHRNIRVWWRFLSDSPRSRPVWAASFLRPHRSPNWHPPRGPALQPWRAGCGPSRPCRAALRDEGPWCPPGLTSPARPPAQLRHSSPPTPRALRIDTS